MAVPYSPISHFPEEEAKRPLVYREDVLSNPTGTIESILNAFNADKEQSTGEKRHLFGFDISGKRHDSMYAILQDYASTDAESRLKTTKGEITHPRDPHNKWKPANHLDLSVQRSFTKWLKCNISNFLKNRSVWSPFVGPHRFLYSFGPRGSGRSTVVTNFCATQHVNLYYIVNSFFEDKQIIRIVEYAKTRQPCVVYFDGAHHIMRDPHALEHLNAAMRRYLDPISDNVWIVMSSYVQPTVSFDAGKNITKYMLRHGSVVYTPALANNVEIRELVDLFLYRITTIFGFANSNSEWATVIRSLISKSKYHTAQEILEFIRMVFRTHWLKLSKLDDPSTMGKYPSTAVFTKHLESLPREHGTPRLTSLRNPESEYEAYTQEWTRFCAFYNFKVGYVGDQKSEKRQRTTEPPRDRERERQEARQHRENFEREMNYTPPRTDYSVASPSRHCTSYVPDDGHDYYQPLQRQPLRSVPSSSRTTDYPPMPNRSEESAYIPRRKR
jgi:hypothetical protein